MSDFYDSLEDECDHDEFLDPMENNKTKPLIPTCRILKSKSTECYKSISLNYKTDDAESELLHTRCSQINIYKNRSFLPKIENNCVSKGSKKTWNITVDTEILIKQGLQLNSDGSFTKSDSEELPFVTRQYKNLQFQKKKNFKLKKNPSPVKINKQNIFALNDNVKNKISMNDIMSARGKKGSSEKFLTSGGESLPSVEEGSKMDEPILRKNNLTDSMKEILLRKQNKDTSVSKNMKTSENLKKVCSSLNSFDTEKNKKSINDLDGQESPKKMDIKKFEHLKNKAKKRSYLGSELHLNEKIKARTSDRKPDIFKYHSAVLLNPVKSRLNYSERRQKENGFNPLCLRYENKKILSDTNRSNFGDSTTEKLSEISSRHFSSDEITDTDEEIFYREMMEKDKKKIELKDSVELLNVANFKSKRNNEFNKLKSFDSRSTTKPNSKCKRVLKSTSIDLIADPKNSPNGLKKKNHFCSANSFSSLSKTELAIKARAYGCMVNARNIFKLKIQSKEKPIEKSSPKYSVSGKSVLKKALSDQCGPKSIESGKLSEDNGSGPDSLPRTTRSFHKPRKYDVKNKKQIGSDFQISLPNIDSKQVKKIQIKNFKELVLKQ